MEPVYEYTKGIGWHLAKPGTILRLKDCTVRLEDRDPFEKEYYLAFSRSDTYWIKEDGTFNYQRMIAAWQDAHHIKDFSYRSVGRDLLGVGYRTVVLVVL